MNQSISSKINQLLQNWPKGTVATSRWLSHEGIRFDLVHRYKESGWIEPIGHGAFKLAGDNVTWQGALYAMQKQLGLSIHPAGKTALALMGKAHYVPMSGTENLVLFSAQAEHLPLWFTSHDWDVSLRHVPSSLFDKDCTTGLVTKNEGAFTYTLSSPERAILELLYDVPNNESLEEARQIFEGLMTLDPDVVTELLKHCTSIKVKRLFMVLSEQFNYQWVSKVNVSSLDFGTGKRMLVPDGFLNTKYKITLPRSWQKQGTV
jgi:hypothetical protein